LCRIRRHLVVVCSEVLDGIVAFFHRHAAIGVDQIRNLVLPAGNEFPAGDFVGRVGTDVSRQPSD